MSRTPTQIRASVRKQQANMKRLNKILDRRNRERQHLKAQIEKAEAVCASMKAKL